MKIPEVNKKYNCFDDGKIQESRRYEVIITEIIPFYDINEEILLNWKENVKDCYWLYSEKTDVFIKAVDEDGEDEIFVRTKDNGWFSIGGFFGCGRLDADGELTKLLDSRM